MKRLILILLSILCSLTIVAKERYFKHLGVSDGLSQACIFSIYQDELGAVWLGTTEGLNRYNGKDIRVFRPSQGDEGLTNNEINELCGDKKGQIYIRSGNDLVKLDLYQETFTCLRKGDVTSLSCDGDTLWVTCRDEIYYYTEQTGKLTFYTKLQKNVGWGTAIHATKDTLWVVGFKNLIAISREDPSQQEVIATYTRGKCISADSRGNLWIGTWDGLYRVTMNREVTYYSSPGALSDNQVRCVVEDDLGYIWVGTFRGLDCYDPNTDTWSHYDRFGTSPNTLSHNSITALHKDRQGSIWIGTYHGGVNVFSPDKTNSYFYCAEPLREDCLSFPFVGRMAEDKEGNLWICTEGGGLNRYDPETGAFSRHVHRKGESASLGSNNLKSIFYRKQNNRLYVGTHLGGMFVLDLNTNRGHTIRNVKGDPSSLPHDIVNEIQEYKDGFAVLTQGGPVFMNPDTETFQPLISNAKVQSVLNREYAFETFLIDSRQRMWLAIAAGGVMCVDLSTMKIERYQSDANNPAAIGRFKVVHIFEDSRGEIYFSTIGSGMFKYKEHDRTFQSYSTRDQSLPSDYCYYICESVKERRLYLLHSRGISVFTPEKEKVEDTYHWFQQGYSQGSALYRSSWGMIYIGGTNGMASFQESSLYTPPSDSFLNFDKLFIFNQEILPNDETGILSEILAKTTELRLNHNQNNVTIEFATFNFRNDGNRLFEYRLDGFDKAWTQTSGPSVTYTNLPPGNYALKMRPVAKKKDALLEIKLAIHVAAPFYATVWAYAIYLLLTIGIVAFLIRFKIRQAALKSSLIFERKEKDRIEELNQIKLRFFTNISHEFRTPLTLILGQIEVLMQMDKLGPAVYNRVLRIYKNAWHMRNLISELLDFRKQEQGYLKLRVEEQDLVSFTRQVYMSFYEYSQKKGINYRFDHVDEMMTVWFDLVQLQKVIFNLLSNAFKYTPNKGAITVEIRKIGSQAVISVSDTGPGIPEEDIQKIFERFYQTDTTSSFLTLGTGIGLALAKGIVDMHHGKIEAKSDVGKGSRFTLMLPLGNRHFSDEEIVSGTENESIIMPDDVLFTPSYEQTIAELEERELAQESIESSDKPLILLVDDNEDLLIMLSELFQSMYEVHIAHNGREGLEKAQQLQPDLILSDVMMPEMSGKEMCYKIKNSIELSHISVVLLTAQTSAEYMVEGLMFGADDYVTKPFNVKVLVARCNNLIKNKKRLMAHYADKPLMDSVQLDAVNERDKELLEKCVSIIRDNFEDVTFDVMSLASELCMGRSKLYAQFKQITGLTPNEFILKVKLDEAMALLKSHPELNITEISVRLGFSSPRYFSKSFKAFFGVAPLKMREK